MAAPMRGAYRLFRVARTDVFVHWSWFVAAIIEIRFRTQSYHDPIWNVAEYLALFGIVLLHEFGHVLACRQVGGRADKIVLWPLGGVAYVQPPPRPGAQLWSIAAGPLVNVILVPITIAICYVVLRCDVVDLSKDAERFLLTVASINIVLLAFNILPVYPLDGGQILHSLLWFVIGQARSLRVVGVIGTICATALLTGAVAVGTNRSEIPFTLLLVAGFVLYRSFLAIKLSQILARRERAPRHEEFACPSCRQRPAAGAFWVCRQCQRKFDTFDHQATCPGCGAYCASTMCPACYERHPLEAWAMASPVSEPTPEEVTV